MKTIHKLRYYPKEGDAGFTKCNRTLIHFGGCGAWDWKDITCKQCLKYKKKEDTK